MSRQMLARRRHLLRLDESYNAAVLADDPVLYLPMQDTSGTTMDALVGTDGSYVGSPTLAVAGPGGSIPLGVSFTNTKYGTVADLPEYDPGAGTWTFEGWFLADFRQFSTIVGKRLASGDFTQWGVGFGHPFDATTGGRLWALHRQSGTIQRHLQSSVWANDNQWHHVAVTYDGAGTLKLYIDGVQDTGAVPFSGVTDAGSPNISTSAPVTVAADGAGVELEGDAAAVALYDSALTATRIAAHFDAALRTPLTALDPADTTVVFHYAADEIVGLADGDGVATWPDLSGNGYDLAQATAGNRPTYQTAELNGLPMIRFDGVNDYMASAAFGSAVPQPLTVMVVGSANVDSVYWFDGITSGNRMCAYTDIGANFHEMFQTVGLEGEGPGTRGDRQILAFTFNGASSVLRVRGMATQGNAGSATTLTGLMLGARYNLAQCFNGDIAEVVGVATTDRDTIYRIGRHLADKYNLAGWPT